MKDAPEPEVYDNAANAEILDYLRSSAVPHNPGRGIEYGGWELMTHPDLVEMFAEIVEPGGELVPVYGRPAVIEQDVIVAVAAGTSWLLFRLPSPPSGVDMNRPIAALEGTNWHAVSAWQSRPDARERLKGILRDARDLASS